MNYQIGKWNYNTETGILESKTESKTLPKLLKQLLMLFIQNNNSVINREELIETLWKNKYVNENALSRAVAELRKELNDSANQPIFIKTIPKKGYQFIHPVIDIKKSNKKKRKSILFYTIFVLLVATIFSIAYIYLKKDNLSSQLSLALNKALRVTAKQGMENQPNLSPDGKKLAYTKIVDGKNSIVIYNLTEQKESLLINKSDFNLESPIFSNSNNEIIATAKSINGCQILWLNLKTLEERQFAGCIIKSESVTLDWSNDDSYIVYSDIEEKYGTAAIWKIDLSNFEQQQMTFPESSEVFDISPKISPDGKYLSFSRGNHTNRNVYLKNLNSEKPATILTNISHYTVSHDWFDDQHIIMDSDQTGERILLLINVFNNRSHVLGARGAQYPTIDKKTSTLSFQVAQFEANIWMVDLKTNEKSLLINSTKYDNNPAFHPVKNSFAYTSNRLNHGTIWTYDYTTQTDIKVFEIPKTKLTRPSWSSDGTKLLVTANDQTGLWSYELVIETGAYKKLSFELENYAAVYIGEDIYAMSKPQNGESTLLKLNAKGKMSKLNINGISRFMPLSNNKLAISKANKNGLFTIELDGSNETILINDFHADSLNHWTTSKNDVYYRESNKDTGIWKINTETMIKEKVTDIYPYSVGPSLSINPEQTKILATKTDRAESDVFITDLNIH